MGSAEPLFLVINKETYVSVSAICDITFSTRELMKRNPNPGGDRSLVPTGKQEFVATVTTVSGKAHEATEEAALAIQRFVMQHRVSN